MVVLAHYYIDEYTQMQPTEIATIEEALKEGFHREEGAFTKGLDKALASFNVQRQAYYSGSFVGNHVHRALQVYLIKFCLSLSSFSGCSDRKPLPSCPPTGNTN